MTMNVEELTKKVVEEATNDREKNVKALGIGGMIR